MTLQDEDATRYSPDEVRRYEFSHRMRGLDEYEVREFLGLLADQLQACQRERSADRVELEQLRAEVQRLREDSPGSDPADLNPHAVALFSQAQQVADQLVAEAVQHARDLMTSARNQQREILQQAHAAAENAVRVTGDAQPDVVAGGYTTPVPEIEYVRTFARVAQVQLRSVLDALTEQVEQLGAVPNLSPGRSVEVESESGLPPAVTPSAPQSEHDFVYPRQRTGS